MAFHTFEDLEVWRRGCRQAVAVIQATENLLPTSLRDQMQRASISVPSNIAEGAERDSKLDFIRFLRISKGSNGELRTQIYIARKLNELPAKTGRSLIKQSKEISAMLQGLIKSVARQPSPAKTRKSEN
jgi:four helix bundle protein